MLTLHEVADELSRRLSRIFLRDESGRRPVFGGIDRFQNDPHWRDYILFYEYFHGDNGRGRRRQPPDRLDRPGRQAAAAERRQRGGPGGHHGRGGRRARMRD